MKLLGLGRDIRVAHLVMGLMLAGTARAHPAIVAPEVRIFNAASWNELRLVHKDFIGRIDGVVAGAFTEKVAELFAERWELLDEFAQLSVRDPIFETDVMAVLNEAVPQVQAEAIITNARTRCPGKYTGLCKRLLDALTPTTK